MSDSSKSESMAELEGQRDASQEQPLPDALEQCISEVVRRTRLWKREKAAVASELRDHFQMGLEAGRSVKQLIETFGDPKLVAKLIRRSKRRCRSWLWHVRRRPLQGIYVMVGVYLVMVGLFFFDSPNPSINYVEKVNEELRVEEGQPMAWPMYREFFSFVEYGSSNSQYRALANQPNWPRMSPGDEGWDEVEPIYQELVPQIELLRKASKIERLGNKLYGVRSMMPPEDQLALYGDVEPLRDNEVDNHDLIAVLLPELGAFRFAARVLVADIYVAVHENDSQRVVDNFHVMFGIARHSGESPILINRLVQVSIERMAVNEVGTVLSGNPSLFSDNQLRELSHLLAKVSLPDEVLPTGETYFFYDTIRRIYGRNGRLTYEGLKYLDELGAMTGDIGNVVLSGDDSPSQSMGIQIAKLVLLPSSVAMVASRDEMERKYKELVSLLDQQRIQPLYYYLSGTPDFDQAMIDIQKDTVQRIRYAPITVLMPALGAVYRTHQQHLVSSQAVQVALASEAYKRKHGQYPVSLADLVPAYLPEAPIDQSRPGDHPLQIRVIEGQLTVYGYGLDGDDDQGRPWEGISQPSLEKDVDGDWVLYPLIEN